MTRMSRLVRLALLMGWCIARGRGFTASRPALPSLPSIRHNVRTSCRRHVTVTGSTRCPPSRAEVIAAATKGATSLEAAEAEPQQELDLAIVPALAICCVIAAICALDRVVMSVAIIPMAADLAFSDATKGLIAASFSVGYGKSRTTATRLRQVTHRRHQPPSSPPCASFHHLPRHQASDFLPSASSPPPSPPSTCSR